MHKGDGGPMPEPPTETLPYDSPALRAFPPRGNEPAGPSMVEVVRHIAKDLPPALPRIDLNEVLGRWPSPLPSKPELRAARMQRLEILSETGLKIPSILLRPASKAHGILVVVDDRGNEPSLCDRAGDTAV